MMTKHNFFLKFIRYSFVFSLAIVMLSSCSEDEDPVTPVDEDITFEVQLLKMQALEIKEAEGDALEVYGNIDTKLIRDNVVETNSIWRALIGEAISVGLSDVPVVAAVPYTVKKSQIANSRIEVDVDLFDSDGDPEDNAPENLGREQTTTNLSDIATSVTLSIVLADSGGQHVEVTYSITRK
ncbi:MAG: hypothetical protein AAFO03_11775 [Bacteroidota bacterium]